MRRVGGIGHRDRLEALEQEGHVLEAVAAMRVTRVRKKAYHRLCQSHSLRRLETVRRRTLSALRGDRARSVREQQAHECLETKQLGFIGVAPDRRGARDIRQRALA